MGRPLRPVAGNQCLPRVVRPLPHPGAHSLPRPPAAAPLRLHGVPSPRRRVTVPGHLRVVPLRPRAGSPAEAWGNRPSRRLVVARAHRRRRRVVSPVGAWVTPPHPRAVAWAHPPMMTGTVAWKCRPRIRSDLILAP